MLWEGSTVCIGIQCTDAKWTILIKTLRGNCRGVYVCMLGYKDVCLCVCVKLEERDKRDV